MLPRLFVQASALFLCDTVFLSLLNAWWPSLALLGALAGWVEAALRLLVLGGLWGLLPLGRHSRVLLVTVATVVLLAPFYLALGRWLGDPPLLLSSAPRSWMLVGYVVGGLALLLWEVLGQGASTEKGKEGDKAAFWKVVKLFRPDALYLAGAFFFLTMAVVDRGVGPGKEPSRAVRAGRRGPGSCPAVAIPSCPGAGLRRPRGRGETFIPYYTGRLIDILNTKYDSDAFSLAILPVCLVSLGSSLSAGCRGGLFTFTVSRMVVRVRHLLFSSLMRQDVAFFQEVKTGDLTSRLSKDTTMMSRSVPLNANILLRSFIKVVGLYGFMLSVSWRLTVLSLIETPIMLATQKFYDRRHQALLLEIQDSIARSGEVVRETVSSIETVRSFATEEEESQRYDAALKETHRLKNQRDLEKAIYLLIRRLFELGLKLLLLYFGYQQILGGLITKGNLVSFILYQMEVGSYVQTLMYIYGDALSNVGAAKKVFEYLRREPSVRTEGMLAPEVLRGHVSFKNISFSYPSRPDVQVVKNVSFDLHPGEVTALVGLNGSGKSTCVALLERFFEPQSGEILLDDIPIQEYEHKYLHRQVALVGQEPILFSGSIRDNIAYGVEDCSMEEVTAAAEEANALGFIHELEGGFGADVGEKGGQLSAGQKQRLAIARALIRKPKVLVLDEATSALDVESEAAIQQSVLSRQARAVLVIAHRMQTVENAHKIVVLEGGQVVEEGTHSELLGQRGPYFRLVQRSSTD
uniref:Antigen peptide transporter 2 n=1 Tax=Anolis carolinensis TaxID=28377 RepID=H9GBR3_ANOCA